MKKTAPTTPHRTTAWRTNETSTNDVKGNCPIPTEYYCSPAYYYDILKGLQRGPPLRQLTKRL